MGIFKTIFKHKALLLIFFSALVLALIWFIKPQSSQISSQDTNAIIVGVSADFPPFTFFDKDQIVGFEIDLVMEIGRRLGRHIEIKNMPFSTLLPTLQLGQLQLIAGGLTATPERAKHVLFTKPYVQDNPLVIVSLANHPVQDLAGLKNQEVIVNEGYTSDLYLSKIDEIALKRLKTPAEAFLALKSGRAIAFVTAKDTVRPFFDQSSAQDFYLVDLAGTNESASLAVSPQYPALLREMQVALDDLEQDGTLNQLKTKWHLS